MTKKTRKLIVLVMSVGPYEKNGTAKYLRKIGAPKGSVKICLPKEKEENAKSYEDKGIDVYVYDQAKYINKDFEYFGFRPRNCGGIGRQGIAEATEKFGADDVVILQLDDDTSDYRACKVVEGKVKSATVGTFDELQELMNGLQDFYEATNIEAMGRTGATMPDPTKHFANRKIFNNFIMRKEFGANYWGFAALTSDDYRFNIYHAMTDIRATRSYQNIAITFTQNQGDRNDGNAVIYNSDCSWKKSFALKMICPWAAQQRVDKDTNRWLFRENMAMTKLHPPICVVDEHGEIVGKEA